MDRSLLTQRAMRAAATVRIQSGSSQASPICIYGVCESLGIIVRFCDVDMEGMYQSGTQPRIHLSALLQASIFDPAQDHVPDARLQFPCLQHVSFVPTRDGLVLNAFYATQYIFEKAYGNHLGLVRLGRFMAHELDVEFTRLNVTVGVAKLGQIMKNDPVIQHLLDLCRKEIVDPSGATSSSRAGR